MKNFFNKLFGRKKEGDHYDPTSLGLNDLRKGFVLDYNTYTWVVKDVYIYDWGDEYITYEYQLQSETGTCYLHVDEDEIAVSNKIKRNKLAPSVFEKINKEDHAPNMVEVDGERFFFESREPAYYSREGTDKWEEMIAWSFYNEAGNKVLTIDQWDYDDFELSLGLVQPPYKFSNILPVNNI